MDWEFVFVVGAFFGSLGCLGILSVLAYAVLMGD